MNTRVRELAALADALAAVLPLKEPADVALRDFFRAHRQLGQHERAFVADGVFAVLRRRRSLIAHAATSAPRALAIAAASRELGLSLRELDDALAPDERAWARELKARKPDLTPAEGLGRSKRAAEQAAATAMLTHAGVKADLLDG